MRQLAIAIILSSACVVGNVHAQQPESIHIVLIQGQPRVSQAEVYVMAGPDERNVIVVGKKATAVDLEAAIEIARHMRATVGDTLTKDIRAVVRPSKNADPGPGTRGSKRRAALGDNLSRLDKKQEEIVPGFGKAKMLDLVVSAEKGAKVPHGVGR